MPLRFDSAQPLRRQPEITPQGWLKADAAVATVGVFPYRQKDGTIRREYRSAEEVFRADSLRSFEQLPVTLEHPPKLLTAEDTKRYQVGALGEQVRQDGNLVVAPIAVHDKAAVDRVLRGEAVQVSPGYTCDFDPTPGVHPEFGPYDGRQFNIKGNHIALVPDGRQGRDVRVRLDAAEDAEQVTPGATVKIKIGGKEREVPDDLAQDYIREQEQQAAQRESAVSAEKSRADTALKDLEKTTGKLDAEVKARQDAEKARLDAADPKKREAEVAARVELITKARTVLGTEERFDGLDDMGIKKKMLAKLDPEAKLEGKSTDYIEGRLDTALERAADSNPALENLRAAGENVPAPAPRKGDKERFDHDTRRAEYLDAVANAWKRPLALTKDNPNK